MANHQALAAVSRTLRTLLLDRMAVTPPVSVTIAPPDILVAGVNGGRINLYLFQVNENVGLKNQEIPGEGHPAAYGRPPLSLNLHYLITTHSLSETAPDADLNAQNSLGDAMRILHDFGSRIDNLQITNATAGVVGDPILDPVLTNEFERVKITMFPSGLEDITKVWSALSESNFRRSVVYEVTVVQIQTPEPRARPQPVETRRILATVRRRPVIQDAYVTPPLNGPLGEGRARVGDEITIVAEHTLADRVYVRLGTLDPIRVSPPGDGRIRITVPDDQYPADLDNPLPRPIPPLQQLQPGTMEVQVIVQHPAEGVEGALDQGTNISEMRSYRSNIALLQMTPDVTNRSPANATVAGILRVDGTRLWHAQARLVEVIVGDAAIPVRHEVGDPWAAPTSTAVEVPLSDVAGILAPTGQYPVAVQVDGARSRNSGLMFTLDP